MWTADMKQIADATITAKQRLRLIRQTRNYMVHSLIPTLLNYLPSADTDTQIALLEMLGWHTYSYMAPRMIEAISSISTDTHYSEAVREEARKTIARLAHK